MPGIAYVLAFDADRLIGHAAVDVNDAECYVDSIVVVRSHWGSGASDALGRAITRHALAQACRRNERASPRSDGGTGTRCQSRSGGLRRERSGIPY